MKRSFITSVLVVVALAFVLRAPLLGAPPLEDDYLLIAGIERLASHGAPLMNTRFNLWSFYDGVSNHTEACVREGHCPWFMEPSAKHSFWRPLSSALMTTIYRIAGRTRIWHSVLILTVYGFCLLAAGLVLRRMLGWEVALFAVLFFSLSMFHDQTSTWVSAMHIPFATALSLLAILAHIRWRADGWSPGRPLSLLGFMVGLAAGELAILPLSFLLVYELGRTDSQRGRARALAPFALLALVYLGIYKSLGFGSRGMPGYADPFSEPMKFCLRFADNFLAKASMFVSPTSNALQACAPATAHALRLAIAACFVALLLDKWLASTHAERKSLVYWIAATVLCSVMVAEPSTRGLFAASLGASVLAAIAVSRGIDRARRRTAVVFRLTAAVASGVLLIGFVGLPAIAVVTNARWVRDHSNAMAREMVRFDLGDASSTDVIVVAATAETVGIWGGELYQAVHGKAPRSWQVLSLADGIHKLRRTAPDTIELEHVGAPATMGLYRSRRLSPMKTGESFEAYRMHVQVLDVVGGAPRKISVRFDAPLDDGGFKITVDLGDGLQMLALPPVGGSIEVVVKDNPYA